MLPLLQGTRILDFTTIVLGPYATQMLGDLGADVIKIEPLQGDLYRTVRPGRSRDMGAGFLNVNRNKRSLAIDLKRAESRELLDRLVRSVDAVVHNMRPRSAAQLGIDYQRLAAINPGLVYAYSAGYGQGGPNADEPAYDDVIQAAAGVAALNADELGRPRYLKTVLCDKVGGLHLAIAVASALAHRAKTGQGCCIEAPMFESTVAFLMTEQLGGASFEPPLGPTGYDRLMAPNRRPFRTRDGYMAILPYTTTHWTAFFELIGRPGQAHSPQVQDPVVRSRDIDGLYAVIAEVAPTRTCAEWLEALRRLDIPCAKVSAVADLLQDEHLCATGFFRAYDHPTEGRLREARSPFRLQHVPDQPADQPADQPDRPASRTGADGREVLASVGYSAVEIDRFAAAGLVALGD